MKSTPHALGRTASGSTEGRTASSGGVAETETTSNSSLQEGEMLDQPVYLIVIDSQMITLPISADSPNATRSPSILLSQNGGSPEGSFREFNTQSALRYDSFCDDFGPMTMLSIFDFIEILDKEINLTVEGGLDQLVYRAEAGRRAFTNAAFLLGAYMILKLGLDHDVVNSRFELLNPRFFEGYRDATFAVPDFRLRLIDCWQGLERGKSLGWVALPAEPGASDWGQIDKDLYAHYNDPLNADLHEVVPQKFVAFRGPKNLGGPNYVNNYERHSREFDPKHYLDIFEDFNVSTVIRLNEPAYTAQVFLDRGMQHFDLYFDDCMPPPPDIVKQFFRIVEAAPGVVAVHCKAGLGRTGTLIALYMMRTFGFSAREAMGWLRIMRPGCVIGEQQHFLCQVDAEMCALAASGRLPSNVVAAEAWAQRGLAARAAAGGSTPTRAGGASPDAVGAAVLAEQISEGMARRDQARARWGGSSQSASMRDVRRSESPPP